MNADIIPFPIPKPRPKVNSYFGGCPECGRGDAYLNIGREHWFYCEAHKVTWCIGTNLFSSWRSQTEADFLWNARRLGNYRVVEPLPPNGAA